MQNQMPLTIAKTCLKTGFGKIRLNNKSFEVKGYYEGEKILASFSKNKKRLENISLVEHSSDRIPSKCAHFDVCGGCAYLNLSMQAQLKLKKKLIEELYQSDLEKICDVVENPQVFHYRNKAEFTFSENLRNEKSLGFITYGSRGFAFNTSECLLIPEWMLDVRNCVYSLFAKSPISAYYAPKNEGVLKSLILRSNSNQSSFIVSLVVQDFNAVLAPFLEAFEEGIKAIFEKKGEVGIFIIEQKAQRGSPTTITEKHLFGSSTLKEELAVSLYGKTVKLKLNIRPQSFFQPNPFAAAKLYGEAISQLGLTKEDSVLDLYCGTGTLGMIASFFAGQVFGIELNPSAVKDASSHILENGITNMKVFEGDVKTVLSSLSLPPIDAVIVDPPRAGLDPKAIEILGKMRPKKIAYIACNPYSQKENVDVFLSLGYQIEKIIPVDQFTHTPHLENIVILKN